MHIKSVSIKLSQPQYDSQDKPLFEVLVDGKPERLIFSNDINFSTFQTRIDGLHESSLVEKNGVCHFHKEICRIITYDADSHRFFCHIGMRSYQIRKSAEPTVFMAKWIADSIIIPKTVDAVAGIDFLITEDEEVYTAWPTLMSVY